MNDNEILTPVRDSFSGVRMRTPLERTVRRGRVLRARRRGFRAAAVAGAAGLAAVTAVTAANLGAPRPVALDAWTVTVGPDHIVTVTVRQLSNAAGLQQTLRADGIPARVAFQRGMPSDSPPLPAGCRNVAMSDEANADLQGKILGMPAAMPFGQGIALTMYPRAIPHGIGIYLAIQSGSSSQGWGWGLDLVQATQACTG
jgi:hypothetical protein